MQCQPGCSSWVAPFIPIDVQGSCCGCLPFAARPANVRPQREVVLVLVSMLGEATIGTDFALRGWRLGACQPRTTVAIDRPQKKRTCNVTEYGVVERSIDDKRSSQEDRGLTVRWRRSEGQARCERCRAEAEIPVERGVCVVDHVVTWREMMDEDLG
ncbi:hypothetical protein LIA77_02548 [Sarocladium implicatum]|nr:hypothetical protein LIA77_02548 [Sarocladium implicatum]